MTDAGFGGFSNVWLVASQSETAVQTSLFGGTRLVSRDNELCWTFGEEDLCKPACTLVWTGGAGWESEFAF